MRNRNKTSILPMACAVAAILALWEFNAGAAPGASGSTQAASVGGSVMELPLEECIRVALEKNRRKPASQFAIAIAEAQHRQALSAYWPQLDLNGGYKRTDQTPNFLFPSTSIGVPAGTAVITVPAGVLGPAPISLPVSTPAQTITVPAQDIKLADEDSFMGSVSATWLVYDGGMRKGLRQQAKGGVDAMREKARRTDLEIVESVKRIYYGVVLAGQLHQVGKDTLARMEATLRLTETMYKEGSGQVKKTDYLDNKIMVETLRSAVALLEKNEEMAKAALANTMGLAWDWNVIPTSKDVPFEPFDANLRDLVGSAYQFSPDWAALEAGIRSFEGGLKNARSGYYPKVALTGSVHRWWNDYGSGIATSRNKEGWSVGVGVNIPLFNGFRTRAKVQEARARLDQIKEQKILLQDGIGLRVKDIFLGLNAAKKRHQATMDAFQSAAENRDLNTRAYQNELVETEDVIRAQLVEAFMSVQHYKMRYDHIALQARLDLVIGTELLKQLKLTQ